MPELCSLLCLKIYSLIYAIAHVQNKIVTLIRICHTFVALKHKQTDLSPETSKLTYHLKQAQKLVSNLSKYVKKKM